jgi:hypothetical protein
MTVCLIQDPQYLQRLEKVESVFSSKVNPEVEDLFLVGDD